MAINEACFALANYSDKLTGGPRGILIPFRAGLSNMIFIERWKYALLMFAFMVIVVLITVWLRRARLGHYLLAMRADEDAARAAGINVLKVEAAGHGALGVPHRHRRRAVRHVCARASIRRACSRCRTSA